MGNCFKTQLKRLVNNNNLPMLGVVLIQVVKADTIESGYQRELTLKVAGTVKVSVSEGGSFTENSITGTEYTEREYSNRTVILYFKNDNYTIKISNKYEIEGLYVHQLYSSHKIFKFLLPSLSSCNKLKTFDCTYTDTEGNINSITPLDAIEDLDLIGSNINGNADNISSFTTLKKIRLSYENTGDISFASSLTGLIDLAFDTKITGNWSSISALTNLQYITAYSNSVDGDISAFNALTSLKGIYLSNSRIGGTIEAFATAQAPNRNSGDSVLVRVPNTNVTYNGSAISSDLTITFDGQGGYSIA